MMTKRSNHMPTLTKIESTHTSVVLARTRRDQKNCGVITSIDDTQINLRELVQDSGGEWVERNSALPLSEAKK